MKYLAIIAILLPLVYGAAVPRTQQDNVDLIPDMSTIEDGKDVIQVPDMSVASDADDATPRNAEAPLFQVDGAEPQEIAVPDMSVAVDAEDNETAQFNADADLVPDMSVLADAQDEADADADLIPDMSVASDAE
ncbi:uncharacterized protein LOC117786244 isoform X8 [Drosophila innubila]|uniref:uncharacterized protein LOC117786244 isoform X8 n=1 Tax=Drosophila innubila TaxID=198719 RepID=UPI00148D8D5D|nr:uncharacterized protein LOC117786244 isoform X8 [Drosophila innubila]